MTATPLTSPALPSQVFRTLVFRFLWIARMVQNNRLNPSICLVGFPPFCVSHLGPLSGLTQLIGAVAKGWTHGGIDRGVSGFEVGLVEDSVHVHPAGPGLLEPDHEGALIRGQVRKNILGRVDS